MTGTPPLGDHATAAAAPEPAGEGMSGAADRAWRHLVAARTGDRAQAVDRLATYPDRWDLTFQDVAVILDRYPVTAWDAFTSERYLRLVGEITVGGLPAVLAAVPDQWWVSPDSPAAADTGSPAGTLAEAVLDHPGPVDRQAVETGVDTALLTLRAQGFITDRRPATDPSGAAIRVEGGVVS